MICPSCENPLEERVLSKRLGGEVVTDHCGPCQLIWFDDKESLILGPRGILDLFEVIQAYQAVPRPLKGGMACPRCAAQLHRTNDLARHTRFAYLRCPEGHGRLISFLEFLKEKGFVQQLSPKQLAQLRQQVKAVNCSNCGGPVRLEQGMACGHCQAALSVFDPDRMVEAVRELKAQEGGGKSPELVAAEMQMAKLQVEGHYRHLKAQDAGIDLVVGLVKALMW